MGNCLVTKLKESIQNENLPLLGAFKIDVNFVDELSSYGLFFQNSEECTMRIVGNGVMSPYNDLHDPRTEQIFSPNQRTYYFSPGNYTIYFENKYALTAFSTAAASATYNVFSLNVEDLEYIEGLSLLALTGSKQGNINVLKTTVLDTLRLYACSNLSGVVDLVSRSSALKRFDYQDSSLPLVFDFTPNKALEYVSLRGSINVTGSILSLASAINLSTLYLRYTQIEGEITDLADLMVQNRNSGTLVIEGNTRITHNGNTFNESTKTITFSNGSYTIA